MAKKTAPSKSNFEDSLADLEDIIQELESGEIPLDKSLEKFEEGVKLFKLCRKKLGDAEKKIKVLTDSLKEEDI